MSNIFTKVAAIEWVIPNVITGNLPAVNIANAYALDITDVKDSHKRDRHIIVGRFANGIVVPIFEFIKWAARARILDTNMV